MLYVAFLALLVFLATVGLGAVCYAVVLLFMKPSEKKGVILLPMNGDKRQNATKIGYVYERLNLLGENECCDIIAVEKNESDEDIRRMFERYNSIKFIQLGDMPDIMSHFWDS